MEELKPCPFCGSKPRLDKEDIPIVVDCFICGTMETFENWQKAYCWKEIDRLEKKISEQEIEIMKLRYFE